MVSGEHQLGPGQFHVHSQAGEVDVVCHRHFVKSHDGLFAEDELTVVEKPDEAGERAGLTDPGLVAPTGVLLPELHDLLQAAVGWTDSHLHQFVSEGICYGRPDLDGPEDERDESKVSLRSMPHRFSYLYDFGDGWEHDVLVVGPGGAVPGCVEGDGPCPPEDVGGPHGYALFREALGDPDDPEHDHLRGWAGNWFDHFDLATTDLVVRQTVGEVPRSVRLLLDLVGEGVTLTPGGRLPRAFVRQVQERYPGWLWGTAQRRSRKTWRPWQHCTTCCDTSASSAYVRVISAVREPLTTTSR